LLYWYKSTCLPVQKYKYHPQPLSRHPQRRRTLPQVLTCGTGTNVLAY
jgi:hypothetical protein